MRMTRIMPVSAPPLHGPCTPPRLHFPSLDFSPSKLDVTQDLEQLNVLSAQAAQHTYEAPYEAQYFVHYSRMCCSFTNGSFCYTQPAKGQYPSGHEPNIPHKKIFSVFLYCLRMRDVNDANDIWCAAARQCFRYGAKILS